jgi:signal transduction histidine kinase
MESFQKLMKQEIDRLSDLTLDLLYFSKITPEKSDKIELSGLVRRVGQLLNPLFRSKQVQLRVKARKSLFLKGNKGQLESLVINLLQNSLKAVSAQGTVEISTDFLLKSPFGAKWLKIDIKDTGRGISPENLSKIYKPFYSTDLLGIGLGLSICQKVVENHQGFIKVKSHPGKGTLFSVYFPGEPNP